MDIKEIFLSPFKNKQIKDNEYNKENRTTNKI